MYLHHYLFALLTLLSPILARQPPTSFCKCICFTNSTIIPLNTTYAAATFSSSSSTPDANSKRAPLLPRDEPSPSPSTSTDTTASAADTDTDAEKHKRLTCADCTRAFCLDLNLPICEGAREEDVFTSCFQRDSLKDETIVLLFIVVTTGLLGWAVLKPWLGWLGDTETVQRYAPVGNLNLAALRGRGGGTGAGPDGLPAYRDEGARRQRNREGGRSGSFARQGGLNS